MRGLAAVAAALMLAALPVTIGAARTPAECQDAIDNDGDGLIDYPEDPGCSVAQDNSEFGECDDLAQEEGTNPVCRDHATEVSIRYRERVEIFAGGIGSSLEACQRGRRVLLKRVRPGRDPILGEDITGAYGNWYIPWDARRGRYYAKATKTTAADSSGATVTCLGDRSTTIRVDRIS